MTLTQLCDQAGKLSQVIIESTFLTLLELALESLVALHDLGIVHADMSTNIIVSHDLKKVSIYSQADISVTIFS